ncbi:MAG: ABC transporter permease [Deltaproteobacteria bacterium]|nr:ABC transporter permease [Deltaproteobacteria bacterium]
MRFLRKCWAFIIKDLYTDLSYRLAFFAQLVFVFFMVAAFYFFGRMFEGLQVESLAPYGGAYFPFVIVGVAFSSYLSVAVRSFSDTIRSAQVLGTLEALLVTPTPVGQIIMMSSIYSFLATSLRVVLTLAIGWLLFEVDFHKANWPGAILVLLLTIFSFSFLGIFSASVVLVFKRADPSSWLVQGLSYLLGGVYYPVAVLPEWGQMLANILPITHALEAMRLLLLKGASLGEVANSIFGLLIFTAIAAPLSIGVFLLALRRVKREGSLSHF